MLKLALLAVTILAVVVLILAASCPDVLRVTRSIDIKATPETIFPLINDFHRWDAWTPYNKDQAMRKTYGTITAGKGATYAWEGNKDVGEGEIAITDTAPPGRIDLELHMIKPIEARNQVVFTLEPHGDMTRVTWTMNCKQNLPAKLVGLFMDMDKMVGGDFDKGLMSLRTVAEN